MTHFYKYVSPDTARAVLQNRTLRWSTPPTLNDPFDMQFAFQLRIDIEAARKMALEKSWNHIHGKLVDRPLNELGRVLRENRESLIELRREEFDQEYCAAIDETFDGIKEKMIKFNATVRDHFKTDKILCFSELPNSIPMWAYYAQNHAGLVLRFTDRTQNNPLAKAKRVRYVDAVPSLFDNEMLSDLLAGYSVLDAERVLTEVTLTKSSQWAHEHEWRVYTGKGRTNDPYEDVPFSEQELDGVIFGARTTEADRLRFTKIVREKYPHAQLIQAKPETITYSLVFDEIKKP